MSFLGRLTGSSKARTPTDAAPLPYDESSEAGLAARWVRWAAATGMMSNPIEDRTGEDAGHAQPADVWFLAGSTSSKRITRRCTVPAGRPFFAPAVNAWESDRLMPLPVLPKATGEVRLDGVALALREIATPTPFEVIGARLNAVTSTRSPCAVRVWGLWARIGPLPEGPHEVTIQGGDGAGFAVDVRYHLTIEGRR